MIHLINLIVTLTLGSHQDHIPRYVLLDDQREASLVPLHTGAHNALYFGKNVANVSLSSQLIQSHINPLPWLR